MKKLSHILIIAALVLFTAAAAQVYAYTIYAATLGGLSISTDGGNTFTNKTTANGLGNNTVYGVYAVGTTVYAATSGGGLSISTDGGNTFANERPRCKQRGILKQRLLFF